MSKWSGWRRTVCVPSTLFLALLCLHIIVKPAKEVLAQADPDIQHSAIECFPNNQHAICSAVIVPGPEIQTARVYFRSDKYLDFYYVEMAGNGDDFEAILPIPGEETDTVIYYVEAVTEAFGTARTAEHDPMVASDSECKRRDAAAAWWTGGNPGIVIGAVVEGASAIPPGFQALGITGFVSAAGAMSSAAGGIGTGAAIGIGAGAAAAATGAVVATGGNSSTTTTVVTGGGGSSTTTSTAPPTTTTTATTANEAPSACFSMEPADGKLTTGDAIRLDARCSEGNRSGGGDKISNYEWDLGDGRSRSGPDQAFITPKYNNPGVYTITLTVTDSGGSASRVLAGIAQSGEPLQDSVSEEITVTAPPVTACFTATSGVPCIVNLDASCSNGDISQYDWVLDTGGVLTGSPVTKSGRTVSHTWPSCFNTTIDVKLTVSGAPGQNDSTTMQVPVSSYLSSRALENSKISTSFTSFLGIAPFDGRANGFVVLNNARTFSSDNSRPFPHGAQGRLGVNEVSTLR